MDRHHALAFKVLKRLTKALLLALLLVVTSLAVASTPGHAQGPGEVLLYEENFDEGGAQGWNLESETVDEFEFGWAVTEGMLIGREHYWATYEEGNWFNTHLDLTVYLHEDYQGLHISVRLSNTGRYFLAFHPDRLALVKQLGFGRGESFETIEEYYVDYSPNIPHGVSISVYEGHVLVVIDGETEFDWVDSEPLPAGTIAVETLQGGYVRVDDVKVYGPPPAPEGPDLSILSADTWRFEEDERVLVLLVEIINQGNAEASETRVFAGDPDHGWPGREVDVPDLSPGDTTTVEVKLGIAEEQRGTTHRFMVEVDPEDYITELDEENNVARTPEIPIPPEEVPVEPTPTETPDIEPEPDLMPLIWIVVAFATLGGITFTIRRIIEIRRHKEWEDKAKEEEPPETCQPCTCHCRKLELGLEPALRKIAHLSLSAYDPVSSEQSKVRQVRGEVVNGLNRAVMARRLEEKPVKLHEQVAPMVYVLLQQIMEWLRGEPSHRDVFITGHLEGGKVTYQFLLYHCKRIGTEKVWEEEDKWKVTIKDERDEPVGTLRSLDPAEPRIPERLAPELTRLLMQFIEKV